MFHDSYLDVLRLYATNSLTPISWFARSLPKNAFIARIVAVSEVHLDNLVLYFDEFFMKLFKFDAVSINLLLPDFFIDGPGNFLDESALKQKF
jgi:hypothetical protein